MGYFPNGTSNEIYLSQYCGHCRNFKRDPDSEVEGCPIMDLHMIWNYDAVGENADETKRAALSAFIETKGIENQQCKMYLPWDEDRCGDTPDMFGGSHG